MRLNHGMDRWVVGDIRIGIQSPTTGCLVSMRFRYLLGRSGRFLDASLWKVSRPHRYPVLQARQLPPPHQRLLALPPLPGPPQRPIRFDLRSLQFHRIRGCPLRHLRVDLPPQAQHQLIRTPPPGLLPHHQQPLPMLQHIHQLPHQQHIPGCQPGLSPPD
jgi:hypothetical protein